jgi:hypothetical protein
LLSTNSGRPGYPAHSIRRSPQTQLSGIALCFRHRFQKTRWPLIADSRSPARTCRPGKKAPREPMVDAAAWCSRRYWTGRYCFFSFISCRGRESAYKEAIRGPDVSLDSGIRVLKDIQVGVVACLLVARSQIEQEGLTKQDGGLHSIFEETIDPCSDT